MAVFRLKLHLSQRNSTTKFLHMIAASDTVERHSLAYLNVHKWLVGNVILYLKFRPK